MTGRIFRNTFLAGAAVLLIGCGLFLGVVSRYLAPQVFRLIALRVLMIAVLMVLLLAALALRAVRRIVYPIHELDIEHLISGAVYPELQPLADRIREQNRTIRRQMDELRARQQEFRAITDHMREGFLLADRRLNILSGNHSALELLSGGAEVQTLWEDACRAEIRQAAQAALDGEHTEVLLPLEEGSYQIIANSVVSDGQVTGVVVIMMDVTEQQERDALRREFTANVSHELKTPLTAISGFAELMKEGLVPVEKVREFSGDIYRECRRLIALVEDIIDLSKLDEGSVVPEKEAVALRALAEETLESLRPMAQRQNVTLSLEGEEAMVCGAHSLLDEMLYNLIDNAIKYNRDGGSVCVALRRGEKEVRLSVSDTGIGIPKADQSRVFERFYRVDKSHSRAIGGTGLGLSIVKHAAQYHDARLELESEPGKGSTFTVIFKEFSV
ncbi:MAG: histidine kinase [Oscillospiraceae bacterium]|nr:histidine kinase [Oscillospiraceae bacterium]